ncbi:MAG: sugar ABC transporter permease [Candidatus Eremiobacteraeota bacterium]|nr:sugar ABC transporter permease [Candidatus Eremiobacteraeota bacterium]
METPAASRTAYLYLIPAALFVALFLVLPLVRNGEISLFDWNLVSPDRRFVGLDNYRIVLGDPSFWPTLIQSLVYVLFALAGNVALPLVLALLTLRVGRREADVYQTMIFLPTIVPVSVGALLFLWLYLPTGGPLSRALATIGLGSPNWFNDPHWALPAVSSVAIWKFFGFNYLILLAGLKAIPQSYLEAAELDGAAGWTHFSKIVFPLVMPTLLFTMVTTILQALDHAFVPIQILTLGGPSGASSNLFYAIYQDAFQFFQAGKASALAVVYLALFATFAIWQFRMLERYTQYDDG